MVLEQFNLKGKVALVTGSSRGLGAAIAIALAEAGASVAIHGSRGFVLRTQDQLDRSMLPTSRLWAMLRPEISFGS